MIGIIGAMAQEVAILKEQLQNRQLIEHYEHQFYTGQLGEQEVVVVQSGIGKVNAAIVVPLLKMLFEVDYIINTGSAGALDSALSIGDVVIAHSLVYHDVDVTSFGYKYGQMAGMPEAYYPDSQLQSLAKEASHHIGIEPYVGMIVSGDQFVAGAEERQAILEKLPFARACEMESTAIAQACYQFDIPFIIIRAISDQADGQAHLSFDEFLEVASQSSATLVMYLVEQIGTLTK